MTSRAGVLIAQLGTPEAPTPRALRRYLRQFLSDRRVVETNRVLWSLILHGVVLPLRPSRSARLYRNVWTPEGSPLLTHTRAQAERLEAALGGSIAVEAGMRYGAPSIAAALERLHERGADRLLVFPMFPQYSSATTGSVHDAVFAHLGRQRVVPGLRVVPPYYAHAAYIGALTTTIREHLSGLSVEPDLLLLAFHGIPKAFVERGDVYQAHCEATATALAASLGIRNGGYRLAYQSRFGRAEWLQPYLSDLVQDLARRGVRRIVVACPGFTADCLETLDEIGREARHRFLAGGGEELSLASCLNSHPAWIDAMASIARQELRGWDGIGL